MGVEIERKFLVTSDAWRALGTPVRIRQGYLSVDADRTVRVRTLDRLAKLTVKGRSAGLARAEFEYDVPFDDATAMLDSLCIAPILDKARTNIAIGALHWEVDEFFGANQGLVVAEVELASEDQVVALPEWIGEDVSGDARYLNSSLVQRPFSSW